jgi:hypothetical protein
VALGAVEDVEAQVVEVLARGFPAFEFTVHCRSLKGLDLYPVLMALRAWGDKYLAPDGEFVIYRHRDCGGRTEVQLVCEQCGADVIAHDIEPTPGPGPAPTG